MMNKLKTLKDLQNKWKMEVAPATPSDDLRQVAREWVEYLENESNKMFTKHPHGKFQADWIKHFFNLEDE